MAPLRHKKVLSLGLRYADFLAKSQPIARARNQIRMGMTT